MDPLKPKRTKRSGPERKIQDALKDFLKLRDWYIVETHGSEFQFGLPDLFACHSRYGQRWVEVKYLLAYSFTPAQLDVFPKLCANGSGVWILVDATEEEYNKLFKPANWYHYLMMKM